MRRLLRFVTVTITDMAGQIVTGLGFMILLGSITAQLWVIAAIAVAMMLLGVVMLRN